MTTNHFSSLKENAKTVVVITFLWLIPAFYQYLDRRINFRDLIDFTSDGWYEIVRLLIAVVLGGLSTGSLVVFSWQKWLRALPFTYAMGAMVISYVILYVGLAFVLHIDTPTEVGLNGFEAISDEVFHLKQLPNLLFWLGILFITFLFLLIRDSFGPSRFHAFLKGRYFRPRREDRVFMFMDLISSTSIAESQEEQQYFEFLNDTFKTITPAIIANRGEIYQYVGDEMVVTWKMEDGLDKANCLTCFYRAQALLERKSKFFLEKYGVRPSFKAGIHGGFVIAGEMGIVKREIVYSGDVLNTTSRIEGKCNEMQQKLLISEVLLKQLTLPSALYAVHEGHIKLRGKANQMSLFSIREL